MFNKKFKLWHSFMGKQNFYEFVICFFLLFLVIVSLQLAERVYFNESGCYPDEGAHFMSGIMVHDYLMDGKGQAPMEFAENYYIHYPKIGIGQWPPLFYLVQALWMITFTVSRSSILVLLALISTSISFTIYVQLRKEFSIIVSIVPAIMFAITPIVQQYTSIVMAEMLLTAFSFWSIIFLARFFESGKLHHAILFALLAACTIMTKGNGLCLAITTPLAVFFTGNFKILRNLRFWMIPIIVLVICLPFYMFSIQIVQNSWTESGPGAAFFLRALGTYPLMLVKTIGIPVLALFLTGFVSKILIIRHCKYLSPRWAVICVFPLSVVVLLCIVPSSIETRHLIQCLPQVFILACTGIVWAADRMVKIKISSDKKASVLSIFVFVCFVFITFNLPKQTSAFGFADIASQILQRKTQSNQVILISSDPEGEGMFITELAVRENRPGHIVLRASKVIGLSDWMGRDYRSLFSNTHELMDYLKRIPVGIILIDDSIMPVHNRFHHKLLKDTLNEFQQDWQLLGSYDIIKYGEKMKSAVKVYSMIENQDTNMTDIKINMQKKFGKDFTKKVRN